MTQILPSPTAVDDLRFALRGGLHEPGSGPYEDAVTVFNAMIEKWPLYVARCRHTDDVVAALAFARAHDLPIAVRGGGHSVAGACLVDDGLVLDLRGMNGIEVDAERRLAIVGGGATWGELDAATQAHGLATTGGRVSTTGVAGLTLGGGSGWLERRFGLACDNVLAATLITADGEVLRVDIDHHSDLFWALKGGGGNFGVVTSLELALHPVGPTIFGGGILYTYDKAAEVMKLWRDTMADAPDELSLACAVITVPAEEPFPEDLHGHLAVMIAGMWCGDVEDGERALAHVRAFGEPALDLFGPMPYTAFQQLQDIPSGSRNYWTSEHLDELPDEAIDAIVQHAWAQPGGLSELAMFCWGGAIARTAPNATPLSGRDTRWVIHPLVLWDDPAEDEANMAYGRAYRHLLAAWSSGAAYGNFIGDEGQSRVRAGYRPGDYERLAQIKAEYDPENVFAANHNIRPA